MQDPALLQAKLRTYIDKLSEVHEIQAQQRELKRRQAEVISRLASMGPESTELQSAGLARELVSSTMMNEQMTEFARVVISQLRRTLTIPCRRCCQ
jgi:hypothetical protein